MGLNGDNFNINNYICKPDGVKVVIPKMPKAKFPIFDIKHNSLEVIEDPEFFTKSKIGQENVFVQNSIMNNLTGAINNEKANIKAMPKHALLADIAKLNDEDMMFGDKTVLTEFDFKKFEKMDEKDRFKLLEKNKIAYCKNPDNGDLEFKSIDGRNSFIFETQGTYCIDGEIEGVDQNPRTGDCYVLSSLLSLSYTQPELIKDAIRKNLDGSLSVTFKGLKDSEGKPLTYTFTEQEFLKNRINKDGKYIYSTIKEPDVVLIEMAYDRYLQENENRTISRGCTYDVLKALSDKKVDYWNIYSKKDKSKCNIKSLEYIINRAIESPDKYAVVVNTNSNNTCEKLGLSKKHAYAVEKIYKKDNEIYFDIVEPHNSFDESNHITISKKEFNKCFASLSGLEP